MRLTDDELTALLADLDGLYAALKETRMPMTGLEEAYPKLRRLATEVRDLRAVKDAARTWRNAADEIKSFDAKKLAAVQQAAIDVRTALARYEEGGR